MKEVKIKYAYRIINHGPLIVVSAQYKGKETYTPIAWHMPVEMDPPLLALCVGKENFVNTLIKKAKSFCINVLEKSYVEYIKKLGEVSGKDVDKLKLVNLSAEPCKKIKSNFLSVSSAIIECKLIKDIKMKDVDIFIGRVLYCQANEKFTNNMWDPETIKTIHHLGSKVFVTTTKL